jgi:hypothetical protein
MTLDDPKANPTGAAEAASVGGEYRAKRAEALRLWAAVLWIGLTVAVCVKTFISPEGHSVYPKMSARAIEWWSGTPLYIDYEGLGRFPYSPSFAVMLGPFAVLGNRLGGALWSVVCIGVYVWGLRKLVCDVLPVRWPPEREAVFMMLAMIGSVRGFWNAQSNGLIIGLLMGGAAAVEHRRWWTAAFLMAAPVYMKVWPVVIPLLVLARWPRQFGPRFAAAMAVGGAVPFLTQWPGVVVDQYRGWFLYLSGMSAEVIGSYRDVWTLIKAAEWPVSEGVFRLVQVLAGVAVLGWCFWQRRRFQSAKWELTLMLAMGTAYLMLFGPGVEYNTFVVLAPMITWALLESFDTGRGRVLIAAAFAMTMVLGAGAIERLLVEDFPAVRATLPVGTLLFVIWLIRLRPSTGRRADGRAPGV